MNPPPDRSGRSRYGGGSAQQGQHPHPQAAFPFVVVDPTEGPLGASAAAVRAFFPAPEAGGREAPSSSSVERYGGGAEISLGHGMQHRYHQFGVEANHDDGRNTSGSLPRHSSSPPGFFSSPVVDNGFPSARVGGSNEVHQQAAGSSYNKKMKSPMNLPRQGTLPQISEDGLPGLAGNMHAAIGHSEDNITASNMVRSFSGGFSIGSWEDSNSIAFSNPSAAGKAGIHNNDDIISTLSNYELQFGVTKEATGVDKYLQMQHDQVPFRVRAKRGCATHPRSIAERERRTRISEKLRKLQALVPNMDKQTSTADMLDLAVEHIRGLQSELQALKEDKEKCNCRGNHRSRN